MVVDHPTTDDTATDAPEPHDELRRNRAGPDEATEDPPDVSDIPSPEDYRAAVDAEYRKHAIETGYARVREIEQNEITPAMRRIESADPTRHLVGLENRLKSEERLSEKVWSYTQANADISPEQAFAKIKDAVRYTFEYQEERYAQGVLQDCQLLEEAGFKRVDLRNTWENEDLRSA